jgi:glycosyltransferase involved in cell wall biosynthesis
MSKRLFEVFLGTYNSAAWIEGTLHSLEAQNCEPFKVIIVDNCSTDNTVSIIQSFFLNFNFRNEYQLVQNETNVGAISSFLKRLDLFESDWLILVHQDDYYAPNHISTLLNAIKATSEDTSIVFTAMKRMNHKSEETFPVPTLSSLLSTKERINNFLITLQISPVNFPASALKISTLRTTSTSCHSTAFNDTELILKLMAKSDVHYIPIETMHYRIYEGNASSITSKRANDLAVSAGLIEVFHDVNCSEILWKIKDSEKLPSLIEAIERALEIRISDEFVRNHTKLLIAESLNRMFGYENKTISEFLQKSLNQWELSRESNVVMNLTLNNGFKELELKANPQNPNFVSDSTNKITIKEFGKRSKLISNISLEKREKFYNLVFNRSFLKFSNRPFIKVWRSRDKNG